MRQQLRANDHVEQRQQRYDVELHLRGGIQVVASSPAPVAGSRPLHAPRSNVDGHGYQRQDALDDSVYPDEGILINAMILFAI